MSQRKSSRGNPWHDARGRFCSGPRAGGVLSSAEVDKVDLHEGDTVKLKTNDGSHPLFHSNPEYLKGKREYEQTLSVEKDKVTLHTKTILNDKVTESDEVFNMSYSEFKELVSLIKPKKDSNGFVYSEFDSDAINVYEGANSELKDYLWYDEEQETNLTLTFSHKGFTYEVADFDSETLEGGDITRDGDNFVITPWNGRPITFKESDPVHKELKDYFRTKELCDLWQ